MIHRMIARAERPLPATATAPLAPPHVGAWTVDEAYRYCERIAHSHTENFPVASRFVPAPLRRHVWAVYAFARAADDIVDEPEYAGRRAVALDQFETELDRCCHGEADHPLFIALRDTIDRRDIPFEPLRNLLTAFRMDLHVDRHPTFASLHNYCVHSAEAVGRLILYIFDYREPSLLRYTDDLSTALQLTKVVQDVRPDLARGRIYLPLEDLSHFGVSEDDLARGRVTDELRDLLRFQVARARSFFERGRPVTRKVGRDLGFELSLVWHGGMTLLDKVERQGFDVLGHRPVLETADKLRMLARSAVHRWDRERAPRHT